jgi:hypothetical protein
MPPDRSLRLGQFWKFKLVDAPVPNGSWWFVWEVYDSAGNKLAESIGSFDTLSGCIADAKDHGYMEPEERPF